MQYQSSFVRYERRGDRVVPVRVTKQWVNHELPAGKQKGQEVRKFRTVRLSELSWRRMPRDRAEGPDGKPVAWQSSSRVDSRSRLMGLCVKHELSEEHGGSPVLEPELAERLAFLPVGDRGAWTHAQAVQPMDPEPETREWYLRRQWAEWRGYEDEPEMVAA